MVKSAWESRVGMLLDPEKHPEFVYSYKPHDSAMYGGQPRIDWLACDQVGRFWMIEVKSLDPKRRSINLERDVSPGQRAAMNAVMLSGVGVPLLMVGQEKTLYVFDWRKISWLLSGHRSPPPLLPLSEALFALGWTGPKAWALINLYGFLAAPAASPLLPSGIPAMPMPSAVPSQPIPPVPSPSTLRQHHSTRTRRREILSGPSFAKLPD